MWNLEFSNLETLFLAKGPWIYVLIAWLWVGWYWFSRKQLPQARVLWKMLLILSLLFLLHALLLSALQYSLWAKSSPSKFFLPPYTPITYFLKYAFYHFFARTVAVLIASLAVGGVFWFANRDYQERFMEPYEIPLFVLGGISVGWPNFFLYLGLGFILALFGWFYVRIRYGISRVRLLIPFLVAALIVFMWGNTLAPLLYLDRIWI